MSSSSEMSGAIKKEKGSLIQVAIFSAFANLLMLTAPLYMLQIYDRVLGTKSEETLISLSILVLFLFIMMGILDFSRGRILARIGARFQSGLDERVFRCATIDKNKDKNYALTDLGVLNRLFSSPAATAFFDLPWSPIFFLGIWIFHPFLGMLSLVGAAILISVAILNQVVTSLTQAESQRKYRQAEDLAETIRSNSEILQVSGMLGKMYSRWAEKRSSNLLSTLKNADFGGVFSVFSKTFRIGLQSAMLGLGAFLVLKGELTAGAMIAASILTGRALAPLEALVSQWPLVQRSRMAWLALNKLLSSIPKSQIKTVLPRPNANLEVDSLTIIGENKKPIIKNINFKITPGSALGVIGKSGSGKTTLARAVISAIEPNFGVIRLDGPSLNQYGSDVLGGYVGYVPQDVKLFAGSVAENISRMTEDPDPGKVVEAAKIANAHELITKLPKGYDTVLEDGGKPLSGGQIQRVALARAMYGNPILLVLDEANSNLDHTGSMALNNAIKACKEQGAAVLVMAHRPSAIELCDNLLVLENGSQTALGSRDAVLQAMTTNQGVTATVVKGGKNNE
jgi:PrtD family type I secretion system ABC transporter